MCGHRLPISLMPSSFSDESLLQPVSCGTPVISRGTNAPRQRRRVLLLPEGQARLSTKGVCLRKEVSATYDDRQGSLMYVLQSEYYRYAVLYFDYAPYCAEQTGNTLTGHRAEDNSFSDVFSTLLLVVLHLEF